MKISSNQLVIAKSMMMMRLQRELQSAREEFVTIRDRIRESTNYDISDEDMEALVLADERLRVAHRRLS